MKRTYLNATIHRIGNITDFVSVLSTMMGYLYVSIEKDTYYRRKNEIPYYKRETEYFLLKNAVTPDENFVVSTRPEKDYNDGSSNGLELSILFSVEEPYSEKVFKPIVDTLEIVGICEYHIYSDYDLDFSIDKEITNYKRLIDYTDAYKNYLYGTHDTLKIMFGGENVFLKIIEKLAGEKGCIPNDFIELENATNEYVQKSIDAHIEEFKKKYEGRTEMIWKDSPFIKIYGYFGVKTNIHLFMLFLLNEYGISNVAELKEVTAEQVNKYLEIVKEFGGEDYEKNNYTKGLHYVLNKYIAAEEYEKIKK